MTSNGIHKDWETLPPLQNPETLKQARETSIEEEFDYMPGAIKRPKMMRCLEKSLFTEEDYKKMEDERYFSVVDPSAIEDIEEWETTFQAQELRDRRLKESKK